MSYTYYTSGKNLKVVHTKAGKTHTMEYIGNHIYEDGALKQTLIEGGYLTYSGNTPAYHFYVKDHLGNNRMVMSASGAVEQVVHYYPYGMAFADGTNADAQRFKYNGKELDAEDGLNWMDYGARMYDAALGRWGGVDALAEKGVQWSPFVYCFNNPVRNVDPDGNWPWENRNVRNARRIASEVNGQFQRWEGQNGQTYASVTTTSYGEDGFTITADVCRPTAQNQHNVVWNLLESIDVKEGHSDGANAGYINKQDVKVGFGIMGVLAGGMTTLTTGGSIITSLGMANSMDDALTNERNESLSQRLCDTEQKDVLNGVKNILSIVSLGDGIMGLYNKGQLINCIDITNTSASYIVEQLYPDYYENTTK